MTIHFYLRFYTNFGQTLSVSGDIDALGNDKMDNAYHLKYYNNEFWHGTIDLANEKETDNINYRYILHDNDGTQIVEGENDRIIDITDAEVKELVLIDTWNHAGTIENAFYTQPFRQFSFASLTVSKKEKTAKHITHEFRVKAPLLKKNEALFITGSEKTLQAWDIKKPLLLTQEGNWYTIKLNFKKDKFPLSYKYGIYNLKEKQIQSFETRKNRVLNEVVSKKKMTIIHDGFIDIQRTWKGAGVAIPVFSLRSKNSFGVGEFTDKRQ